MRYFFRAITIAASVLALSGLLASSTYAQTLQNFPATNPPSFSCGPFLETYVVYSLDGVAGAGVRCVKWSSGIKTSNQIPAFAWYGEGHWETVVYRHVGQAFASALLPGNTYQGYATDMYGNGENVEGDYRGGLVMTVIDHDTIRVTGGWNELWRRVSTASYVPLPPPITCGQYFDRYRVQSLDAYAAAKRSRKQVTTRVGEGVRCVMRSGGSNITWLGFGTWEGTYYMHLVTKSEAGYGSSDFCASSQDFCGSVVYGGLRKRLSPTWKKTIIDGWNEIWLK